MAKRRYVQTFQSKPANYVLLDCRGTYVVLKRKGNKPEYSRLDHFIGFFTKEQDAWKAAMQRVNGQIGQLEDKLKYYAKQRKKVQRG